MKVKNLQGWSPLAESISYGDRQTSKFNSFFYIKLPTAPIFISDIFFCLVLVYSLLHKLKVQARSQMEDRRPNLVKALQQMGDFYMELKWDFQSWGIYFSLSRNHPIPLINYFDNFQFL